ncbi:MAG TPA: hypothetical protein VE263_09960 [Candidatus Angelobacter sp.]|nr:hypothetical protein [Candidatus Angelobacter sp.]
MALLISIFILLLISVVAIALIVSSGTESALAGNYRASTSVYYEALAGLEEARSRLVGKGPSAFKTTNSSGFPPAAGTPLLVGNTYYLINPVSGESITPWVSGSTYEDKQFNQEFAASGFTAPTSPSPTALSIWNRTDLTPNPNPGNYPGPLYKWVRINAVSEKSLNVVADSDTSPTDGTSPLYYTGAGFTKNSSGNPQVIELTSFAILPNGSQKILQYVTASAPITLPPFLAALTLSDSASNPAAFHAPNTNSSFSVKGNNQDCNGNPSSTPSPAYPAIGVFTNADTLTTGPVIGPTPTPGIPPAYRPSYTGLSAAPDVENIGGSFPANLQIPANLDAIAQTIIQSADVVITPTPSGSPPYLGTATGSSLTPLGMTSSNPLTVVVNGNLDISNWSNDGYGLLLVTGTFTYDPDTTWDGIILVIGQGIVAGSHLQNKQINGAMLVAKTRDGNNVVLSGSSLGGASVIFSDSMQGYGIRYSYCWIQKATPLGGTYKVLSFHEIAQP